MIAVLGCVYAPVEPTAESDGMFLSMATRTCRAIRDLKTLEAVGA